VEAAEAEPGARSVRDRLPRLTDRLALGPQRLEVSPICLGATREPETVLAAFRAGINFFFVTADMHWPLYEATRLGLIELLRSGLARREEIVIAGVSYVTQPEFGSAPFEELAAAIPGIGMLDVKVAGGGYAPEIHARLARFGAAHHEPPCRAVGASFHDRVAARTALGERALDVAFVRYNARHPGALIDLFPFAGRRAPALLYGFNCTRAYLSPEGWRARGLGEDLWLPEMTDHYRFALTRPELDGALVAPRTPAEVSAIERALERGPLSLAEEDHLLRLSELALTTADQRGGSR
jgi:hypothetical protein